MTNLLRITSEEGWRVDEQFPYLQPGTKPKMVFVSPRERTPKSIVPGHRYLFKVAHSWRAQQAWSEYIAYHFARLAGLDTPPCFIGLNEEGELGAVVEFFYGHPNQVPRQFVHGVDILASFHRTMRTGRPNNIRENIRVFRSLMHTGPWAEWWAATTAFDALIGNGDRHTENWGFMVDRDKAGKTTYSIAPVYDNGSSLGSEHTDKRLRAMLANREQITSYILRGRSHLGMDMRTDAECQHFQLCAEILKRYPQTKLVFEATLGRFDLSQAERIVQQCVCDDTCVPFSATRAEFVVALVSERMRHLRAALEL